MSRAQVFEAIYDALQDDATLLATLGPRTTTNQRVYRTFPQTQQLLSGYEPASGEGWLVIQEGEALGGGASTDQFDTMAEVLGVQFHIFCQRLSMGDDVADMLDALWHWTVEQQRAVQYGERVLTFARRVQQLDKYHQETKLYEKVLTYRMEFVLETLHA